MGSLQIYSEHWIQAAVAAALSFVFCFFASRSQIGASAQQQHPNN